MATTNDDAFGPKGAEIIQRINGKPHWLRTRDSIALAKATPNTRVKRRAFGCGAGGTERMLRLSASCQGQISQPRRFRRGGDGSDSASDQSCS